MVRKKLDNKVIIILLVGVLLFINSPSDKALPDLTAKSQEVPGTIEILKYDSSQRPLQSIIDNTANVSFVKFKINVYNTGSEPLDIIINNFNIVESGTSGPSDWFDASQGPNWFTLHLDTGQSGHFIQKNFYDIKYHEGGTMTVSVVMNATLTNSNTTSFTKNATLQVTVYPDSIILPNGSPSNFIPLPKAPPAPVILNPKNENFGNSVPISWAMPSGYNGTITQYQIKYTDDGVNWKHLDYTTSPSYTWNVAGLPRGKYAVKVRAFDGFSWGGYQMSGVPPVQDYSDVLVLCSDDAPTSCEVADYFMTKRNIPAANLCKTYSQGWDLGLDEFKTYRNQISACLSGKTIRYLVVTRGMSAGYNPGTWPRKKSVDNAIMYIKGTTFNSYIYNMSSYRTNPEFYNKNMTVGTGNFTNIMYVSRLDGWTVEDAKKLVDMADKAWGKSGLVVLDQAHTDSGVLTSYSKYGDYETSIAEAKRIADARGYETAYNCVQCGESNYYLTRLPGVGFLASWGSNDGSVIGPSYTFFDWVPGAIADTAVSTSAAGITNKPDPYGQSKISDLTAEGASGAKGYTAEPYIASVSRPHILFERYSRGYNIIESYYMATPVTIWQNLILGDPKMAPYVWSPFTLA